MRRGETPVSQHNYMVEALARARTRQSWNERLEHWERPASDSEEAMIERAARMVRGALSRSSLLSDEGVQIEPQGSYYNNTNVRKESDIDLRATHPALYVKYDTNVVPEYANQVLGYFSLGRTHGEILADMRREIIQELGREFGALNLDTSGKKAIKVNGVPGTRSAVDVVPCFRLDYVIWDVSRQRYWKIPGVAILDRSGWTFSYPDQHHRNGIDKRTNTQLRFKKIVRMLKHLRDELVASGALTSNEVPSFLVESLVHGVEDVFFTVEQDDRYDRLLRIAQRMRAQIYDQQCANAALEINGINPLFLTTVPTRLNNAKKFADLTWQRLIAA
jgi:hypothetical protein